MYKFTLFMFMYQKFSQRISVCLKDCKCRYHIPQTNIFVKVLYKIYSFNINIWMKIDVCDTRLTVDYVHWKDYSVFECLSVLHVLVFVFLIFFFCCCFSILYFFSFAFMSILKHSIWLTYQNILTAQHIL